MINKWLILFCTILFIMPAANALVGAIGNARAVVQVNASPEAPAVLDRTIAIENRNDVAVNVTITIDEKYNQFVDLVDKQLTLQPGESKKARYTVSIDRGGSFEIKFYLAFRALDQTLKENKVGVVATLIINSIGPNIPLPEDIQEETPSETEEPTTPFEGPGESPSDIPSAISEPENTNGVGPSPINPLIGIGLIIIIVAVGLGIFFVFRKLK